MDIHTEFETLMSLDPTSAEDFPVDDRALEAMAEIMGSTSARAEDVIRLPRRRRRRRIVVLVAAAVMLAVVGTGVLVVTGDDSSGPLAPSRAYGSWRPTVKPLSAAQERAAVSDCRASGAAQGGEDHFVASRTLITERRGAWLTILLGDARGRILACLEGQDSGGSHGSPFEAPTRLAPTGIDTEGGYGNVDNGKGNLPIWASFGYVGSDVTGVTLNLTSGLRVAASVRDGVYVASYPDAGNHRFTYTLTLSDGSTITRDELGHLGGTPIRVKVEMAKAQRLTRAFRAADRSCRTQLDLPADDTSDYRAGRPYTAMLGSMKLLIYRTKNNRLGTCQARDGEFGTVWGAMMDVPAGSIATLGGVGRWDYGLVGRDVTAVTVHWRARPDSRAHVADGLYSYRRPTWSANPTGYTITRADGSVTQLKDNG